MSPAYSEKLKRKAERLQRLRTLRDQMRRCSAPALNALDARMEKYLDFDGGVFIEAGANDGYTQSNTYYYETVRGWNGILVEAVPETAEICRLVRPGAKVYNCALVANDYPNPTVTMKYANLTSIVKGLCNDDKREDRHVRLAIERGYIARTYDVETPARTLTSVIEESGFGHIDFFSLDVEHFELSVLAGLDFDRFGPTFLLVETRQPDEVARMLPGAYRMVERMTEMDFLFSRKPG